MMVQAANAQSPCAAETCFSSKGNVGDVEKTWQREQRKRGTMEGFKRIIQRAAAWFRECYVLFLCLGLLPMQLSDVIKLVDTLPIE